MFAKRLPGFIICSVVAFLASCSDNPIGIFDSQTLTPRNDIFFVLPEKYQNMFQFKGMVKTILVTKEDEYSADFPFYIAGPRSGLYCFDKQGYLDSTISLDDSLRPIFKKIYIRKPEEHYYKSYSYDIVRDSAILYDSTVLELDYDNRAVIWPSAIGANTHYFNEFGLEESVVYQSVGYDTSVYDSFGKILESTFYAYDGDMEHRFYEYYDNGFHKSTISDVEVVDDSTRILTDTLNYFEYFSYDQFGNWTEARLMASYYSNWTVKNYFTKVKRQYSYY